MESTDKSIQNSGFEGETRLCTGARNAGGAAAGLSVMDAVPLVSLLMERNSATV